MAEGQIFYFCYSHDRPTGGQKQTYRHVDILNRHGLNAYALHTQADFRLSWFENRTRTIDHQAFLRAFRPETDFVVVPEDLGDATMRLPGRKVIFNQNLYYGFHVFREAPPAIYPYLHPDVVAVLAVSDHNAEALRFACPGLPVLRVFNGIDPSRFAFRPLAGKKAQVACIAKAPAQLAVLYHTLQLRARQGLNTLLDFDWVYIKGKTEQEVAGILGESLLFVFLGFEEGLPLMPLEAMASGCLVVGLDAGPGVEILAPTLRFPVGQVQGIASRIEEIARSYPAAVDRWEGLAIEGRQVAGRHDLAREEASVMAAWRTILSAAPTAGRV
jgi:glycosyltransferase involved in cell wall biosynthesis